MTTTEQTESARVWLARHLADRQLHVAGGILTRGAVAGYSQMALRRVVALRRRMMKATRNGLLKTKQEKPHLVQNHLPA